MPPRSKELHEVRITPRNAWGILWLCSLLQLLSTSLAARPKRSEKCGIYLAPSTIPGAGMGMFAGHIAYEKGDLVSDFDLVIPLIEIDWHNGNQFYYFLWDEYVWSATMFEGMEQEVETKTYVNGCSGGFGAAVNCRMNLVNVADTETGTVLGMSGVSSESPGAGAFTPYYGRQFKALKYIPPGMELYASYGKRYFETRAAYSTVPLPADYKNADTLLQSFRKLQSKAPALSTGEMSASLKEDLYNLMTHDFAIKSRTLYALPENVTQIDHVLSTGGTANSTYNVSIRSLDWLEEHGQCMDNIKDGVSQIPHAGRGAFANRFIPKDGLVAPLPLIHVGDRNVLTMYDSILDAERGVLRRNASAPYHQQLLLNYCFGHRDTSLLLCPYGLLTALINHSHQKPNARIVWSKNQRHPEWLEEPHHTWDHTNHAGLSFDLVALRDIEEDEEILIDYGEEWEKAWQEHVANFDVPRRGYMPAFEMNQRVDLQIKTIYETDYEQIEGIYTYCRKPMVDLVLGGLVDDEELNLEVKDLEDNGCYPCRVIHRSHNDSYIAELFVRSDKEHPTGLWEVPVDRVKYVLLDVPRDTFYFRDAFYARDHHQYWTFRHDMRMPDDIFPTAWRDSLQQPVETATDDVVVPEQATEHNVSSSMHGSFKKQEVSMAHTTAAREDL